LTPQRKIFAFFLAKGFFFLYLCSSMEKKNTKKYTAETMTDDSMTAIF